MRDTEHFHADLARAIDRRNRSHTVDNPGLRKLLRESMRFWARLAVKGKRRAVNS